MYILTSLIVRVALFAEGGLEMRCGSPHLIHLPEHKPARATSLQVSVNFSHPALRFPLCAEETFGMGTTCVVSHSSLYS